MQTVSESWKAIENQQLVNEAFVDIELDVTDPDAVEDATASDNGAIYISDTADVANGVDKQAIPYATLEQNIWVLDGSNTFIPKNNYGEIGYISSELSNAYGIYTNTPVLTLSFSETHTKLLAGLTIVWGEAYGEYAESFVVTVSNNGSVVLQQRIDGNKSVRSIIDADIQTYDEIQVEVIKWCLPYRRARILEFFIGINKIYTKSDLMSYEHEMEVSPIGASLPTARVQFGLNNVNNEFDPNNQDGLAPYLITRQEIRVTYGLRLNDNTIERIKAGTFYLSEWQAPQNGIEANFEARDLLEFLQKTYTKGQYYPNGISMYDLAEDVFDFANLPLNHDGNPKYVLDDCLKDIYTVAPLPLVSLAICLQYIAQASCCVLYSDRQGTLHIEPISTTMTDYEITDFVLYSRPEISLQKPVSDVVVKVHNNFVDDVATDLFKGTLYVDGTKDVTITYSEAADNVSTTVTNGTLNSATYYANTCVLNITGTGDVDVLVSGYGLKTSDSDYVVNVSNEGEQQPVSNPLITSNEVASAVGTWVASWVGKRKTLSYDNWRADPRLDATDKIKSQNKFDMENVRMTNVKYTFYGAFHGSGEGRVL